MGLGQFGDWLGGGASKAASFMGLGGSGATNKFKPQSADITNPFGTNAAAQQQIAGAQGTSAGLLSQQGALAGQLVGKMNSTDPRLDELIAQVKGVASGTGPNPAQQQFQQNINQAVQQQAGGVASTRGLNPALAARMAGQGGASMMQGAAGQAATLQAQQQIAAQGLAGGLLGQQGQLQAQYGGMGAGLLGTMGGQGLTQQQILQAALANQNAQRVAMQSNVNNVGAGVAAQNASTGASAVGGLLGGIGSAAAMFASKGGRVVPGGVTRMASGGEVDPSASFNWARTGIPDYGSTSQVASPAAAPVAPAPEPTSASSSGQDLSKGIKSGVSGLGALAASMFAAKGGQVPGFDRGGDVAPTPGYGAPTYSPPTMPAQPAQAAAPAQNPGKKSPQSELGKQLKGAGSYLQNAGDSSLRAFREFSGGSSYAPYVLGPQNFARGGVAQPGQPGAAPTGPEPVPGPGDSHVDAQSAGIARTVAESLARMDPKAAAVVYADLTGLPHDFTPDETRSAYHMLALHNAALLAQPNGPTQPPPPRRAPPRRPVTTPEGENTVPLKRAMGGQTFSRAGKVPGRAEVDGDSQRNDKVRALLSPGEIVIPRTVAQAPDAPHKAARFVAHLVAKKQHGFARVRRS